MADKRNGLSKKIRFEVFKRDSFRCQYCGKPAPDVILVVDHIVPVKGGGCNEITNLITACESCNQGKGARSLNDNTVIEKQRKQMEELNERRQQLEMMMQWRNALQDIEQDKINAVVKYWKNESGYGFTEHGLKSLSKIIKKHGVEQTLNAIDRAVAQYGEYDDDGNMVFGSIEKSFSMMGRIANMLDVEKEKPYMPDLLYLRGILRNRLGINKDPKCQSVDQKIKMGQALKLLESIYRCYHDLLGRDHSCVIEDIKEDILRVETYDDFNDAMLLSADYVENYLMQVQEGS